MQNYVCFFANYTCVCAELHQQECAKTVFGHLNKCKYDTQYCCFCYVILQIVTLALLEINLCLVITVLSQEIQMVNFGFRTSGDSILLKFVLLRQS